MQGIRLKHSVHPVNCLYGDAELFCSFNLNEEAAVQPTRLLCQFKKRKMNKGQADKHQTKAFETKTREDAL